MRKLFTQLFLLYTVLVCSQSGKVYYEAKILTRALKLDRKDSVEVNKLLNQVFNSQKSIGYLLEFNTKSSLFKKEKEMGIDEGSINLADIQVGNGKYYTNLKENKAIKQHEFSGDYFLIEMPQLKWNLTQERKKIGKYFCFKATTEYEIDTRRGKSKRKITAWYTNEIPFNFGPKEYFNLPGLIIELYEDSLFIQVSKIELSPKNKLIKKPKKGTKITKQEYDLLVRKTLEQNSRYRNK